MKEQNIHIDKDPELPEMLKDARRNHGGQTVPADFFAQFEKKINAAIDAEVMLKEAEKAAEKPQITWYKQRRNLMGLAASFILIVVVGIAMHVDHIGHKLNAEAQNVSQMAETQAEFDFDDPNLVLPDMVEESYLATTNDYELYEYYCEI